MSLRQLTAARALAAGLLLLPSIGSADLFPVQVVDGARETTTGDTLDYTLYLPQPGGDRPAPPYPAVVLTHGFARNKRFHANNAAYMAERGLVVLTPNMSSLFGGESAQLENIENTADHLRWLAASALAPDDPLFGLVDADRLGLAGHSAGGAVSFEAAIESQRQPERTAALCLLDAVPWTRTTGRAADLPSAVAFCSLRSGPSACNANNSVLDLLADMAFPVEDIRVVNGSHCDPENPSDLGCSLFCGGSDDVARDVYQRLMYLFFQDAFGIASVEAAPEDYSVALANYETGGLVVSTLSGNPPTPTPTPTTTPSPTPTPTPTSPPTVTPTPTPTPPPTPTPALTPTPTASTTPTPTPTPTPIATPSPTPAPRPTSTLAPDPTLTPSPTSTPSPAPPAARLRFAHLSPDAPPVDVFANGEGPIATGLSFPGGTAFLNAPAGEHTLDVVPSGAPITSSVLTVTSLTLSSGESYSVVAYDFPTSIGALALTEDLRPTSGVRVRAVHTAAGVGEVDVLALDATGSTGSILFADLDLGAAGSSAELPPGPCRVGLDLDDDLEAELAYSLPALPGGAIVNLYAVNDGADVFLFAHFADGATATYHPAPATTPLQSILDYLLGIGDDPLGLDLNGDGKVDIADAISATDE